MIKKEQADKILSFRKEFYDISDWEIEEENQRYVDINDLIRRDNLCEND